MSLQNVFNGVINNKTFGSGLNQKKFSGKVSTAAVNMGSTKGRGSTTRMLNYCTQHSEAPSDCIDQFISVAPPPPPPIPSDVLFNISSFNKLSIEQPYLGQLINSAQRWNKYLKINTEVIKLIRQYTSNNWSGIEMDKFILDDSLRTDYYGETITRYAKINTSLVKSFELRIYQIAFNDRPYTEQLDIMTHELGHALGLCNNFVKENGFNSGKQLLPNTVIMTDYLYGSIPQKFPYGLTKQYFPRLNKAYNLYGGMVDSELKKFESDTILTFNNWNHIPGSGVFTTTTTPQPPYPYMKKGFLNEIMIPTSRDQKLYISEISLGYLLDLYSNLNNINYYTYERKSNTCEVNLNEVTSSYSLINFNITKEFNVTKEFNEFEKGLKIIKTYLCATCMEELP